jgi:hypothetical protein
LHIAVHPSPVLVVGFLKSQLASSELLGVAVFDARFRDSVLLLSIRVYKRAAVMMSVNADVVELLIRKKNETPVELFSLDGHATCAASRSKRWTSPPTAHSRRWAREAPRSEVDAAAASPPEGAATADDRGRVREGRRASGE